MLWQCVSMMPYAHKTGWTGDVPAKKNGQTNKIHLSIRFGGASGSRTLAPVSRPIAFRVRPLTTTWVMLHILNFRMLRAFWENFGENFRRERPKIVRSRSRKTRMKPSKIGKPLPKSQLDFESFSLRPLRYISKYIFMANLRFVYRKSALKLGTVAVRILLENASFRQALQPVRTSKLTFPLVILRHPAKHPLGFLGVLVTTASIHLHNKPYTV